MNKIPNTTAVSMSPGTHTSNTILCGIFSIFYASIRRNLEKRIPHKSPTTMEINPAIKVSMASTLAMWRFSIPSMLYTPNSFFLRLIKKLLA